MDEAAFHHPVKHWRDWVKHESYDAYWKEISDEEKFRNIRVPVHTQGGWFDIFLAGTINGLTGVRQYGATEKARLQSRMIIGPWGHGPSRKFGDLDFGPEADRKLADFERRWHESPQRRRERNRQGTAGGNLLHGDQPLARRAGLAGVVLELQ